MENLYPGAGVTNTGSAGVPDYYDRLRETDVFEAQSLDDHSNVGVDDDGTPVRIHVQNVTPSFFELLRFFELFASRPRSAARLRRTRASRVTRRGSFSAMRPGRAASVAIAT